VPSDAELRHRFREGTQPHGEIDVDAVLRRARRRRRPRVVLAGAGSVLAIAAIAVPAAIGTSLPGGAGDSAADTLVAGEEYAPETSGGAADAGVAQKVDPDRLNPCGARVAEQVPAAEGLVITVAPVSAPAGSRAVEVVVTLTNAGDERITGTTGSRPSLTLARDGIALWHTNGPQDLSARVVDLAPGQSMSYPAVFEPVVCSPEDDERVAFRPGLPPLGPGEYALSAAIEVTSEDGSTGILVTGPATTITLT
jgi:hypothetical protein